MQGWIKLHRKIVGHWVYQKPEYLHAWITILMTVNHEDKKVLIHGEIIECNRGQSILSLYSWTKLFGRKWTIQKVRTFFDLLKSDAMINTEGLRKTTRLTVCNYDNYQDTQHTNNTQVTFKQQTDNTQVTTTKECKNDNNDKNDNNPDDKSSPDFIQQLILQFQEVYLQSRDIEYIITNKGKERTATSKLLSLYKSKNPESNTKQTLEDLNKYFYACINIGDNWLHENMSLPIIINQFNKINNILRNGKKTKSGANWQEVAGFIARDFG